MIATGDTSVISGVLNDVNEYLASGYYENPGASALRRMARGLRRHFERSALPAWQGEALYPTGTTGLPVTDAAVRFFYSSSLTVDAALLEEKTRISPPDIAEILRETAADLQGIYRIGRHAIPHEYSLGGGGFTHSIINYGRILREGLSAYAERNGDYAALNDDPDRTDFYEAMTDIVEGLKVLLDRIRDMIGTEMRRDPNLLSNGREILKALRRTPFSPAESFYDSVVGANLMWYVDGCDNFGRIDQDLGPYLEADLAEGTIDRSEALELVRMLWYNVDANSGWNVALGGSGAAGQAAYNTMTELCLEAAVGTRRPNLALRVRQDTPDRIFDRALDTIASGCGLPALYNEEGYLKALPFIYPDIGSDVSQFAFGGCTETMVHGCSNVGSIDGGLNLLGVLSKTIHSSLVASDTFDDFMQKALADIRTTIADVIACVNEDQRLRAEHQPQPLRSLLIDDCLERGVEFNSGGRTETFAAAHCPLQLIGVR